MTKDAHTVGGSGTWVGNRPGQSGRSPRGAFNTKVTELSVCSWLPRISKVDDRGGVSDAENKRTLLSCKTRQHSTTERRECFLPNILCIGECEMNS